MPTKISPSPPRRGFSSWEIAAVAFGLVLIIGASAAVAKRALDAGPVSLYGRVETGWLLHAH